MLATGLIQRRGDEERGRGLMAAFQVGGDLRNHYLYSHAVNERSDELQVRFRAARREACLNFPILDHHYESPLDHEDDLVGGLLDMYSHIQRNACRILDARRLWAFTRGLRVRQIIRATMYYLLLLRRMEQPGAAASTATTVADLKQHLRSERDVRANALLEYERHELLRWDVPVFYSRPGSCDLESGRGDRYPGYFPTTAIDQMRRQIVNLDTEYSHRQAEIVRYHLPVAPPRQQVPDEALELLRLQFADV